MDHYTLAFSLFFLCFSIIYYIKLKKNHTPFEKIKYSIALLSYTLTIFIFLILSFFNLEKHIVLIIVIIFLILINAFNTLLSLKIYKKLNN